MQRLCLSPTNGEQRGGNAVVFKSSAQTFQAFDNFNQKLNEYAHEHYICTKTKQRTGGGRGKKEEKKRNNETPLSSFPLSLIRTIDAVHS